VVCGADAHPDRHGRPLRYRAQVTFDPVTCRRCLQAVKAREVCDGDH
jgi:hypothetical protein